ncbi:polyketide biosynthesis protein ThaF-like [Schistocerca serialis cubense]|uniref:polyketide biosynthesis protein ThaF-like n=1 Tax=Schistocerca serialis cubense TaxID=2023355 RepID=UPI00214ECB31|nr:polyketide biosynthesis protein ThaF-like [Schistocerca serialis cubense]
MEDGSPAWSPPAASSGYASVQQWFLLAASSSFCQQPAASVQQRSQPASSNQQRFLSAASIQPQFLPASSSSSYQSPAVVPANSQRPAAVPASSQQRFLPAASVQLRSQPVSSSSNSVPTGLPAREEGTPEVSMTADPEFRVGEGAANPPGVGEGRRQAHGETATVDRDGDSRTTSTPEGGVMSDVMVTTLYVLEIEAYTTLLILLVKTGGWSHDFAMSINLL